MRNNPKTRGVLWLSCALWLAGCSLSDVDALSRGRKQDADGGDSIDRPEGMQPSAPRDAAVQSSSNDAHVGHPDAGSPDDSGLSAPTGGNHQDASAIAPGVPDSGSVVSVADAAVVRPDAAPASGPTNAFVCPAPGPLVACVTFDYAKLINDQGELPSPWDWIEPQPWNASAMDVVSVGGNKLLYAMTTGSTADDARARLGLGVPTTLASLHVEYDFWSQTAVTHDYVEILRFQQETPDGSFPGTSIAVADDGFYTAVSRYDGTKVTDTISPQAFNPPLLGKWVRISADFTFGLHGSLVVSFDGKTVFNNSDIALGSVGATQSHVLFGLYSPGHAPFLAYFDNLLLTWK